MMKNSFLFAALFLAALSIGFIACDNDDDPRLDNDKDNIENVVDGDSTEDNIEGEEDYYNCDSTEIVCTGKAYETTSTFTKIAATVHVSTTLLGQCTLGVQFSENLNDLEEHENVKSITTSNLTGNDYIVKLEYLQENTTYYYCAYVYINGIYHYGLIRSFKTLEYDKIDGHAYVDLGLPSGLKWAACNVGATKSRECGNYYAWGEVEPKEVYDWSTYKWMTSSMSSWEYINKYTIADGNNEYYAEVWYDNSGNFIGDNKTVLDPEDDAAAVNMGGSWRMPTVEEQDELKKCTWTWITTFNGVNGYNVEGPNGNSIFFPAAGLRANSDLINVGLSGLYWSSSLDTNSPYAGIFSFDSYYVDWNCSSGVRSYRYVGRSVRGVIE